MASIRRTESFSARSDGDDVSSAGLLVGLMRCLRFRAVYHLSGVNLSQVLVFSRFRLYRDITKLTFVPIASIASRLQDPRPVATAAQPLPSWLDMIRC
jgi:hypothetical protein